MGNKLSCEMKKLEEKRFKIVTKMNLYKKKVKKLSDKIMAIDKRCDELAFSNSKNYFDLWNFIEKEVEVFFKQICICDKIIYEECLFIPWQSPVFQRMKPPSYIAAMDLFTAVQREKKTNAAKRKQFPDTQIAQWKNISQLAVNGLKYSLVNQNKKSDVPYLSSKDQHLFELNKVFGILKVKMDEQVKLLMKYFMPYVVCPDCDAKSTARFSEKYSKDDTNEATVCCKGDSESHVEHSATDFQEESLPILSSNRAHQVFDTTSNIVTKETEFLVKDGNYSWKVDPFTTSYFGDYQGRGPPKEHTLAEIEDINCDPASNETIEKYNEVSTLKICTNKNHSPYINPLDVSKAIENFTIDLQKAEEKAVSLNVEEILRKNRISACNTVDPKEVSDYWESYLMIFNKDKIDLWETMLPTIQDYLIALQKRHNLNAEMKRLRTTIKEFSKLLNKYDTDA